MSDSLITPGDVVFVNLSRQLPTGYEQEGRRPAIVVGIPSGKPRFPVVIIAPLTTANGSWAQENPKLYPTLPKGAGGLPQQSRVLLDQIRSIGVARIENYLGSLGSEYDDIKNGLRKLLAC